MDSNPLTQEERLELLKDLGAQARRLLRVARAKGDVRLINCAVEVMVAILEAI